MRYPLTEFDRMVIESGIRSGKSNRAVAMALGRRHSAINYEVTHNSGSRGRYRAKTAHLLSQERHTKKQQRKLEKKENEDLKQYVVTGLKERGWSPDVIAGRLQECDRHVVGGKTISHEAIYDYIYNGEGRYEYLYPYLKRSGRKRKKRRSEIYKKERIPSKISIHQRPRELDTRIIAGHWESDTVEGKKGGSKQALSVQYERIYKITKIHRVLRKTADETLVALQKTIGQFPLQLMKSFTFDNGGESARHVELRKEYGIQTYHCDPYASWQKGGVENTNGLIRHYIQKGTDIATLTDEHIQWVEDRLNNTPRKSLHYLTPYEALAKDWGGQI